MKRKSEHDLEKVTLNLVRGDMAKLQTLFPKQGGSFVIREIVHAYLKAWSARLPAQEIAEQIELEEIAKAIGDMEQTS